MHPTRRALGLSLLLALAACPPRELRRADGEADGEAPAAAPVADASPRGPTMKIVQSDAELEGAWEETVTVVGVYQELLLPRSARPGSPLVPSGRVEIQVGERSLALETHEAGVRPGEEKARFLGRRVRVTGTLRRHAQLWGTPAEAAIVMAAITQVRGLELADAP